MGNVMKKTKKFSRYFITFLAAVTLVAAVAIPESGRILLYADTNETIYEQKVSEGQEDVNGQSPEESEECSPEEIENAEPVTAEDSSVENESVPEEINEQEESSSEDEGDLEILSEENTEESGENETDHVSEEEGKISREQTENEEEITGEITDVSLTEEDSEEKVENEVQTENAASEEESEEMTFDRDNEDKPEEEENTAEEYIEEEEEEPAFVETEVLAGAKTGELPVSGGICRIRLLKNGDTVSASPDGYVITLSESAKEKQKFYAEKKGKNWRFINTLTGQALVVTKPDGNGGRFVALEAPTGGKRELWRLVPYGKGYGLQSVIDGRVLTAPSAGNGNYVILTDGKGVKRQIWTFTACKESISKAEITVDTSVGSGAKSLIPTTEIRMGGRLLVKDVDYTLTGGSVIGSNKLIIQGIGNYSGKTSRFYEIVKAASQITDGGFYLLIPKQNTGYAMTAQGGGMVNGTKIVPELKTGSEKQIFLINKTENGYIFKNAMSEKAFAPGKNAKGAEVSLCAEGKKGCEIKVIFRPNGAVVLRTASKRYLKILGGKMIAANKKITDSAYYYLVPVSGPSMTFSDTYYIRSLTRIRLVAGISASSKANGASAILSNYSDAEAQRFEFLYSGSGYYRIVGEKSRKVLTANADGTVTQQLWTAAAGQRWKPVASEGGYLLKNAEGKVLSVVGDYVKRGRSLGVSYEDGTSKQKFLLLARGSGEAKRNLVRKPLTIYKGTDYSAVYDYDDYMDRYTNLADIYGTDCEGALKYFVEIGISEGQHGSDDFDVWCYRRSNPGVRRQLLADIPAYYLHYIRIGRAQGLKASGSYQTTQATSLHDLAWKCYNEYGDFSNRTNSQQMCTILSAAAEVQYQAYGFPKSIIIAMAIKECGFLTFNGGLPPSSNNVLTMNVDMWNGKWKSGWLGGYASVKVPQYDSTTGQLVYGYEDVRCYEDIEACMEDFANFKTTLLGPVPAGMSIEAVVDKYLEGYATSPGYKNSILATIKLHQLTRFDH